jgi:hypothetical protein
MVEASCVASKCASDVIWRLYVYAKHELGVHLFSYLQSET